MLKEMKYIIDASEGEIDYSETNIIYLTNVVAVIKLIKDNTTIKITSDYVNIIQIILILFFQKCNNQVSG